MQSISAEQLKTVVKFSCSPKCFLSFTVHGKYELPVQSSQTGEFTRVLALQPAEYLPRVSDALHAELLQVPSGFQYVAISYAWGFQDRWTDLVIEDSNQHQPPTVLRISPTVDSLLRRLRRPSSIRYLWIDALCINQADDAEKMQQVSRMFDIYRMASRVIAWLPDESASDLLKVIKSVAIEGDDFLKQHIKKYGVLRLQVFFHTPWFRRRWVIQEVAAARKVVFTNGYTFMDFDAFAHTLRNSNLLRQSTKSSTLGLVEAISKVRDSGVSSRHLSFAALFPIFHNAKCSDDTDRIYSLLGLDSLIAPTRTDIIMMPDYSLSTIECYESFATKLAARSIQDLFAVMQCAGAFPQENGWVPFVRPRYGEGERIPSWVPDWTRRRLFRPLFCNRNSLHAGHTSPTQPISQGVQFEQRFIRLDGLLLGRITHMSADSCPRGIRDEYIIRHVLNWWLVLIESGLIDEPKYSGDSRNISEDFARIITAGLIDLQFEPVFDSSSAVQGALRHISKETSRKSFNNLLISWLRRAGLLFENHSLVTMATVSSFNLWRQDLLSRTLYYIDKNIPLNAGPEVRRAHQIMKGRKLFVTDSGHMGICSPRATEGDIVGIPFGASTPFVFRPCAETEPGQIEQRVSLVSNSYVEGVMEGQACHQPGIMRCTFLVE